MDLLAVRAYLNSLPEVEECQPFGEDWVVYKIGGRMFAIISFFRPEYVGVKCEPERAEALRGEWDDITAAYHLNKRHWNDLRFDRLPDSLVQQEIQHSYLLVIEKNVTPRALREELLRIVNNSK